MLLLLVLAAVTAPTLAKANLPHPYGNYLFPEAAFPGSLVEEEASDPTLLVLAAPEQEAPVPWPISSGQPGMQQKEGHTLHAAPKIPVQAVPSTVTHENGRAPPPRQPSMTEVAVPPRPFPEAEPGPAIPQNPLAGMGPGPALPQNPLAGSGPGPALPQNPLAGMGPGPALPQRPLAGMGPGPALPQNPLAGSGPGPAIPPPRFPMRPGPAMSPQSFPGPQGGQVIHPPVQRGNGAPRPMNPVPLQPPPTVQGMGPGPARPAPFSPGFQFRPASSMTPGRGMRFNFN
ncbi:unnamed protein product [Heligmosomoides polygyrus]|uniref:Proline-rich protein 2-like n=1 Tax=Heligmosomoides polygyrus TaxID=6339 RepID=A0A183GF55_HELPZ|nr:unnamed protein product [Heligmosomoides polygyrus]